MTGIMSAPGCVPTTSVTQTLETCVRSGVRHNTMGKMLQDTVSAARTKPGAADVFRNYILPNLSQIPSIKQYISNRISAGYVASVASTISIARSM